MSPKPTPTWPGSGISTRLTGLDSTVTRRFHCGWLGRNGWLQSVLVFANGALVNFAGGLGHPIEIMDLSFTVQGVGCHELARGTVPKGVNVIDPYWIWK